MVETQKRTKKAERAQNGTARAALLGVSDGLVSNVSVILGVAAAGASPSIVRIAGIASLVAGAISMSVGEYVSMRGQVELLSSVLADEHATLHEDPEHTQRMLEEILQDDGVSKATAAQAAKEIGTNHDQAMSMYARGKLGINPNELGAAWGAAGSSLVMFAVGAIVPLLPWFYTGGTMGIIISLSASVVAALVIGAYLGISTNGKWVKAALRQLLFLMIAATATFVIGRLLHTTIS
jgi:VIT1/CCC1 family predicted Fe2+/Mn2+ transporter